MHAHAKNILYTILLLLIASCSKDTPVTEVAGGKAIAFTSTTMNVTDAVRNVGSGHNMGRGFVACGYKKTKESSEHQYIMPMYDVRYEGGTYDYLTEGQPLAYWDQQAQEYRFWGFTGNKGDMTDGGRVLEMHDIMLQVEEPTSYPLFSMLYIRKAPITYEVVSLQFKRPIAKLCLKFYNELPIREGRKILITDISLSPAADATAPQTNRIWNSGTVRVTYPLTGTEEERVEVLNPGSTRSHLTFLDVTLDKDNGSGVGNAVTALIPGFEGEFELPDIPGENLSRKTRSVTEEHPDHYYPLPMGDKNPDLYISLSLDGKKRTVIIPEEFTHWEANKSYTYIIKITNNGEVVLHDAQIEGWTPDGSQENEFNNW